MDTQQLGLACRRNPGSLQKEHECGSQRPGLNTRSDILQGKSHINFIFLICGMEIVVSILESS